MMLLKRKTLALWATLSTLIAGFILKANVALAASATDPFAKTQTDAAKLTTKIQTWSVIIIVLVVVATAVAYALGGKQVKKWVRSYWWGDSHCYCNYLWSLSIYCLVHELFKS
ncbi:MAG: hypothetical protein MUW51_11210 [Lactococcus lactis]|nr:hypothetical protein [Lactococcus lactis]